MSKLNKIFNAVPVDIPDRSGFDLSHEVLTTAQTGTVVPVSTIEVLPGDTISMGSMLKVTLPPFAVPFMGRIDAELTAAFIPNRLLWNGWQSFITANAGFAAGAGVPDFATSDPSGTLTSSPFVTSATNINVPVSVPTISNWVVPEDVRSRRPGVAWTGPGSLASYLGVRFKPDTLDQTITVSALPFLAYHKFMDDWCIDDNNMKPFFPKVGDQAYFYMTGSDATDDGFTYGSRYGANPHSLPFLSDGDPRNYGAGRTPNPMAIWSGAIQVSDVNLDSTGSPWPYAPYGLGELRQRCWSKDYFTTATTRPQAGADASVTFSVTSQVNGSLADGTGNFTIAALRSANSLQKWLERNNIAGTDYGSQILAHFGVTPPDATLNRSLLLGSVRTPVVVNSVENTSVADGSTYNPYGAALGAAAGFGSGYDKGNLVDDFTAKEHGFIMVFFTLIPHQYYNNGVDRSLYHTRIGDFAWPEFAGIGDQPIYASELITENSVYPKSTFGYQQRYVEYKHKLDVVNGLLQAGENLAPYALQRSFSITPELGKSFLEIPTDYLDQVLGVSTAVGGFGCIVDAYFDCKAVRTLPEYSLPHL